MTKVYAVRVHQHGGPEVLRYEEVEVGHPGPGEARVRHTAIGLNFTDIHFRTGRYPLKELPHVIGMEAAAPGSARCGAASGACRGSDSANRPWSLRRAAYRCRPPTRPASTCSRR